MLNVAYGVNHGNHRDVNRLTPFEKNQFNLRMLDRIPLIRFPIDWMYDFIFAKSVFVKYATALRYASMVTHENKDNFKKNVKNFFTLRYVT